MGPSQEAIGPLFSRGVHTTLSYACADPESFVRGGPNLTGFFFQNKYHYKRAIIGPPGKKFKWRFAGVPMMAQQ